MIEVVGNLSDGTPPEASLAQGGPFFTGFLNRMQYFVRTQVEENGVKQMLSGEPALKYLWGGMEKKMSVDADVGFDDLEIFQKSKWLLTPRQQTQLAVWANKIVTKKSSSTGPASTAADTALTASKVSRGPERKRQKKAAVPWGIMKYF